MKTMRIQNNIYNKMTSMRGSGNFRWGGGGGPAKSDKKSSDNVFFLIVLSLFFRSHMVNFKENSESALDILTKTVKTVIVIIKQLHLVVWIDMIIVALT